MMRETIEDTVNNAYKGNNEGERDANLLGDKLNEIFDYEISDDLLNKDNETIIETVYNDLVREYDNKESYVGEETFRNIERYIMLEVLDTKWRQHLKDLTELREGIRLRSYGQRNPIHDYKIVGFDIYNEMIDAIKRETSSFIMKLKIKNPEEETSNLEHEEISNISYDYTDEDGTEEKEPVKHLSRRERKELERKNKKKK